MTIEVPEEDRTREARLVIVREYLEKAWETLPLADELPPYPDPSDYQAALDRRIRRETHVCFRCPSEATTAYVQHRLNEYPRWLDLCTPCAIWLAGQDMPAPEQLAEIQQLAARPGVVIPILSPGLTSEQVVFIINQLDYLHSMYEQTEESHYGEHPRLDSDRSERDTLALLVARLKRENPC